MEPIEATLQPVERVLLCFDEQQSAQTIIRSAARLATEHHAELYALYVESPGAGTRRAPEVSEQLARNRQLAHDLGAQVEIVCSHRIADSILVFARQHRINIIVLGRSHREGWRRLLHAGVTQQIVERSGAITIHQINGSINGVT